jgi:hypothetical protein
VKGRYSADEKHTRHLRGHVGLLVRPEVARASSVWPAGPAGQVPRVEVEEAALSPLFAQHASATATFSLGK